MFIERSAKFRAMSALVTARQRCASAIGRSRYWSRSARPKSRIRHSARSGRHFGLSDDGVVAAPGAGGAVAGREKVTRPILVQLYVRPPELTAGACLHQL